MCLAFIALAELFTSARRGPATTAAPRTAARAAAVAPLLPRAAVGIGTGVEGFDVLGLEVFIRISIIIPMCGTASAPTPSTRCRPLVDFYSDHPLDVDRAVTMNPRHLAFVVPAR